jgi:hypothetical protein
LNDFDLPRVNVKITARVQRLQPTLQLIGSPAVLLSDNDDRLHGKALRVGCGGSVQRAAER